MRKYATIGALAVTACLFGAAPTGCANNDSRGQEVRASAVSLRKTLTTTPAQVDSTMNALFQATSGDNNDRLTRYRDFKTKFSALKEDGKYIGEHAKRARADSAKYFKEWAAEAVAANPSKQTEMSAVMEGRQVNYDTALSYLDGGRDSYKALVADLTDIEKALDANLAVANSAEIEKKVNTAKLHAVDLKSYSAVLSDRIDASLAKK